MDTTQARSRSIPVILAALAIVAIVVGAALLSQLGPGGQPKPESRQAPVAASGPATEVTAATSTASGTPSCLPGQIPRLNIKNFDHGATSSTVALAMSSALSSPTGQVTAGQAPDTEPKIDLSRLSLTPLADVPTAPVWAQLGDRTYIVQSDTGGKNWYALAATFEGCSTPQITE